MTYDRLLYAATALALVAVLVFGENFVTNLQRAFGLWDWGLGGGWLPPW